MKHIKGIITADWHIRKAVPVARIEDEDQWLDFQFGQVDKVKKFAIKNKLPIYQTGDLYDKSQPYYGVVGRLRKTLEDFDWFYRLAGNHDLPYISYDNVLNSGWHASVGIDMTTIHDGAFHFGTEPQQCDQEIMFVHQLIFPDEKSKPPADVGKTAQELLNEFPNAKWIFTGDYHKTFHYENNGRHVVNPGCLIRQKVSEDDYTPGFFVVDTAKDYVKFHRLDGDTTPMRKEHVQAIKQRDNRIDAFIEKIKSSKKASFSFKENLDAKLNENKISKGIRSIIVEVETEIGVGVKK